MARRTIPELKDRLQTIMDKTSRGGGVRTSDIVLKLKRQQPRLIKDLSTQLVDRALIKLVSEVARRRIRSSDGTQGDLFGGFAGIPRQIEITYEGIRRWKKFEDSTIAEVRSWLSEDLDRRNSRRDRKAGISRLLRQIEAAGATPNMTVKAALSRYHQQGELNFN